ncbi:hypothetical protein [Xanthomonas sacchari]|uniref:hypothetical protein n=1 Tax=Xanthomonas sacchari TaxID=56458 RepID=UPI003B21DB8F
MEPNRYLEEPMDAACLFTGAPVSGAGEHVIPRWLARRHQGEGRVLLGGAGSFARLCDFKAPADPQANAEFGRLEQRLSEDWSKVADDEAHLWLMKLSAGMMLLHRRFAKNARHPAAPAWFNEHVAGVFLKEFRAGFAAWKNGAYVRDGSLVRLPWDSGRLMVAHLFGASEKDTPAEHGRPMYLFVPYGLMAVGQPGVGMLVATFFEPSRDLETYLAAASTVPVTVSDLACRADLSRAFATAVLEPLLAKMSGTAVDGSEVLALAANGLQVEFADPAAIDSGFRELRAREL